MTKHLWHGHNFWLHPNRLMYWEDQNILIGSDLHLGKTGHFRKAGIAMPAQVYREDLQRLFDAVQQFKPKKLLIVGDLFHSEANKELEWFIRWRNDFPQVDFHLVKGNHDLFRNDWYEKNGLSVCSDFELAGLRFLHDPSPSTVVVQPVTESLPTISGHLHPGVSISGGSRQTLRFPCFYFTENQCILPAFSMFTGIFSIKPNKGEQVFVITPGNARNGGQASIIQVL